MAWYNPGSWDWGSVGEKIGDAYDWLNSSGRTENEFREVDPSGNLGGQAGAAGAFADTAESQFARGGRRMDRLAAALQRQARGEDSLSDEQLRQGLQRNMSAMRSMAASASPANAPMAARTAMIQGGRMASGMAGDKALAGIAERKAATDSLSTLLGQRRQQDLGAALQSRGNALSGYGTIENARTSRFGGIAGQPTRLDQALGAATGFFGLGTGQ